MGRKRIHIAKITSEKRRRATFMKRRRGLLKKAMELSILCECEVVVFVLAKDEISAYTTNGDANETVQRAMAMGPVVTHNGMYESLYYGAEEEDSADDFEGDDEPRVEPAGGSLTSKPVSARAKRKRDQVAGPAPPEPSEGTKRRTPLPRASAKASGRAPLELVSSDVLDASHTATAAPIAATTGNDSTTALLQQMAILSQLLHQQTSHPGLNGNEMMATMSANLLGAMKSGVDQLTSPSAAGITANASNANSTSPLIPMGELSPGMTGLSPHFPFAGLTPPSIPSSLSPPALDGHILDVNFSGSPARDIPSFQELSTRLKNVEQDGSEPMTSISDSRPLSTSSSTRAKSSGMNFGANSSGVNGLGLRVSVPSAPRVFNIPPHLMSSTAPPTNGPISGNNSSAPSARTPIATNPDSSPTDAASKFPPPPLMSSLQAPAFPFAPTPHGSAVPGEWAPLQSPLVNPSSFNMYSPFLYSPRI